MSVVLNAPQGFAVLGRDGGALLRWEPVAGAAGYRVFFYRQDEPEKLIKSRYAQGCVKSVPGFTNGTAYLVQVCAYTAENGREILGERTEKLEFVPISNKLKAQGTICLKKGETAQLVWERGNSVPAVTFSSSRPQIASVDAKGLVTAHSQGTARITLTAADKQKFVTKTVVERSLVSSGQKAVLMFAGDIMCTAKQQREAAALQYDFHHMFARLRGILSQADFAAGALEVSCCDGAPYEFEQPRQESGLPNGNAPSTFISAAAAAGFGGMFTTTNRSFSGSSPQLRSTVDEIKRCGMKNIGTLGDVPVIVDINGIRVAFIACTMVQNVQDVPADGAVSCVNPSGVYSREYFTELVNSAHRMGAEFIAAYQHWGSYNSGVVKAAQVREARFMAEAGADLIFGSHPHMVQRSCHIRTSDGRRVPCAYSLGNLLSSMSEMTGNRDGVILRAELRRTDGGISADVTYIPCMTVEDTFGTSAVPLTAVHSAESYKSAERTKTAMGGGIGVMGYRKKVFLSGSALLKRIFGAGPAFRTDRSGLLLSQISLGCAKKAPEEVISAQTEERLRLDLSREIRSNAEYCAVDLFEAACAPCCKLAGEIGEEPCFFTWSAAFRRTEYYKQNADSFTVISPPFGESVWRPLIKRYAQRILAAFPADRVILFRCTMGSHTAKGGELRLCEQEHSRIRMLRAMEDYFISLVGPLVVDLSGHYFLDGDRSGEFEEAYYTDAYNAAVTLTSGSGRTCVHIPDQQLWFDRVMKYYQSMTSRSYQSWLLDMSNAADLIIAYTSEVFAAAGRGRLLRLRSAGRPELASVRSFFEGDSGADGIIRAAEIINAVLNGRTDKSYEFFEPAFKGHYGILRKLARLLSIETGAPVNEENAELVFLLRGKPQLRRYISELSRVTLDIWGSNVSRESANCSRGAFIGTCIFKQPPILAFEPPVDIELPEGAEAFCGSKWRRRTLQDSLLRSGDADIRNSEAQWILIDFYDVIGTMAEYRSPNGNKPFLFETDSFIRRTDFYSQISGSCSECYLFERRDMKYCSEAIERFAGLIQEKYGKNIILIKTEPKNKYITLEHRLAPLESDKMFAIKKRFISLCEERFASLTQCYVIDISRHFFASDSFRLGGADLVHYEDEFYRQTGEYIRQILSGSGQRVYNRADENYIMLRDLRLGR